MVTSGKNGGSKLQPQSGKVGSRYCDNVSLSWSPEDFFVNNNILFSHLSNFSDRGEVVKETSRSDHNRSVV